MNKRHNCSEAKAYESKKRRKPVALPSLMSIRSKNQSWTPNPFPIFDDGKHPLLGHWRWLGSKERDDRTLFTFSHSISPSQSLPLNLSLCVGPLPISPHHPAHPTLALLPYQIENLKAQVGSEVGQIRWNPFFFHGHSRVDLKKRHF